jgi:hypothetical protein
MPIFWENDFTGLPLPDWIQAGASDFETRMAQLVLLLRPDGLMQLQALIVAAQDEPILVPADGGFRAMYIVTPLDVQAKAGGWLRVSCDICFEGPGKRPQCAATPPIMSDLYSVKQLLMETVV